MPSLIEETVEFIIKNNSGEYTVDSTEELKKIIEGHLKYGTLMTVRDKDGIASVIRWNWLSTDTMIILDAMTRDKNRGYLFLKQLIALIHSKNPQCEYFCFERQSKYPNRKFRVYKVREVLRRR